MSALYAVAAFVGGFFVAVSLIRWAMHEEVPPQDLRRWDENRHRLWKRISEQ